MINIKELTKRDTDRWVLYTPSWGGAEKGRIKSWNDKFIFVVYKCNNEWDNFHDYTGCATNPTELEFIILKEKLENGAMLFAREDIIIL